MAVVETPPTQSDWSPLPRSTLHEARSTLQVGMRPSMPAARLAVARVATSLRCQCREFADSRTCLYRQEHGGFPLAPATDHQVCSGMSAETGCGSVGGGRGSGRGTGEGGGGGRRLDPTPQASPSSFAWRLRRFMSALQAMLCTAAALSCSCHTPGLQRTKALAPPQTSCYLRRHSAWDGNASHVLRMHSALPACAQPYSFWRRTRCR